MEKLKLIVLMEEKEFVILEAKWEEKFEKQHSPYNHAKTVYATLNCQASRHFQTTFLLFL